MITNYKISILINNASLKLTYQSGKFKKLEVLTGKLSENQIRQIGIIIPPNETDLNSFKQRLNDKITYEQIVTEKTLYTQFLEEWNGFYYELHEFAPKFTGADGNALKQVIAYLTKITQNESEALALWQIILKNWSKLDDFYKKSPDLKFINSQLNKILTNVKRINQNNGVDADYLKSVVDSLQS